MDKDFDYINERKWDAFLMARPEFRKWYEVHLKAALKNRANSIGPSPGFQTSIEVMDWYGENNYSIPITNLYKQAVGLRRNYQADLDDGEVMAWIAGIQDEEKVLVPSSIISHVGTVRLDFEETKFARSYYNDDPYLRILIARKLHEDPSSQRTEAYAKKAQNILYFIEHGGEDHAHVVWDTDSDFIRTVCHYDVATILIGVRSRMVIDKEYLDHFLLVPRPDPIEISESSWHDMAMRFVKGLDDGDSSLPFSSAFPFSGLLIRVLTEEFMNKDMENMTFMETVYRLCNDVYLETENEGTGHEPLLYRPGLLEPRLFDMLREYGPSFVRPLIENAMHMMVLD